MRAVPAVSLLPLLALAPVLAQGAEWVVLRPTSARSQAGASFAFQDDGSLLVSGPSDADAHVLDLATELAGIRGLRLEALRDPGLPRGGPGRAGDGSFRLSEIELAAAPLERPKDLRPIALAGAGASRSDKGRPALNAIDGNPDSAWGVTPGAGEAATLFLRTAEPVGAQGATLLRVTLRYGTDLPQQIGRLRLSVTTDAEPLAGTDEVRGAGWAAIQGRVNDAIERGVDALLEQQELDGSWRAEIEGHGVGATALVAYTLQKSGLPREHPGVRRALTFLRVHPPRRTYSTACTLLALCANGDAADRRLVEELSEELVSWQQGGWGYPQGEVDLSNTQYAALGLRAAASWGVKIRREVWEDLGRRTLAHQEAAEGSYAPAGFSYVPQRDPTGSMTAAGVSILAICEQQIPGRKQEIVLGRKRGVEWLTRHFAVTKNPHPAWSEPGWEGEQSRHLYYLYGLERVGALLELRRFGARDWYREGALFLVDLQADDGRWHDSQPDTCFALLFLSRATARATGADRPRPGRSYGADDPRADVSLRAAGDTPLSMWISSFGRRALEDLGRAGEPGLRVGRVEYRLLASQQAFESELLQAFEADFGRASGGQRFAAQHAFERPGNYWIAARVHVLPPGFEPGEEGAPVVLESAPLEVRVRAACSDDLMGYAGDPGRNLLEGVRATARASSELNELMPAGRAFDNLQATGWLSAEDDPLPTLACDLSRPVRADTLLLSHRFDARRADRRHAARARRVELRLNGKRAVHEIELARDDWRKTVFSFPKATVVRRVELRVLETWPGDTEERAVGFAEVELQLRQP